MAQIVSATANAFKARAVGIDSMKGDVWEIDEKNEAVNATNLCR